METCSELCIPSIQRSHPPATYITPHKSKKFSLGKLMESVYPLLEITFTYLDLASLQAVSRVSKEWRKVAVKELLKRNNVSWIKGKLCYISPDVSENFFYNNAILGIFLHDGREHTLTQIVCCHPNNSHPVRAPFAEYIANDVVRNCYDYCMLSCPKFISDFEGDYTCNHCDHMCSPPFYDGIMLPKIPHIRTAMFHVNPKETLSVLKPNERVRGLIIFYSKQPTTNAKAFLQTILEGHDRKNVALIGGLIQGIKSFFKQRQESAPKVFKANQLFCIGFFQNCNTDAEFSISSMVITGENIAEEAFQRRLQQLKDRTRMRAKRFGIRVCCSEKKGTKHRENRFFHRIFPATPLLSMEVNGEFGWDSFDIPLQDDDEPRKKKFKTINSDEIFHQWSSVFLIVTWGKKI